MSITLPVQINTSGLVKGVRFHDKNRIKNLAWSVGLDTKLIGMILSIFQLVYVTYSGCLCTSHLNMIHINSSQIIYTLMPGNVDSFFLFLMRFA